MKDTDTYYNGGFSPSWVEDEPIQNINKNKKDLETLLNELEEIKGHLKKVQEKQWALGRLIEFHKNGIVKE